MRSFLFLLILFSCGTSYCQWVQLVQTAYGDWRGAGRTWEHLVNGSDSKNFFDVKSLIDERETTGIVGLLVLHQDYKAEKCYFWRFGFKIKEQPIQVGVIGNFNERFPNSVVKWRKLEKNTIEQYGFLEIAKALDIDIPEELVTDDIIEKRVGINSETQRQAWVKYFGDAISKIAWSRWQFSDWSSSNLKNKNYKSMLEVQKSKLNKAEIEYNEKYQKAKNGEFMQCMKNAMGLPSIKKSLLEQVSENYLGSIESSRVPGYWSGYDLKFNNKEMRKNAIDKIILEAKREIESRW